MPEAVQRCSCLAHNRLTSAARDVGQGHATPRISFKKKEAGIKWHISIAMQHMQMLDLTTGIIVLKMEVISYLKHSRWAITGLLEAKLRLELLLLYMGPQLKAVFIAAKLLQHIDGIARRSEYVA